MDQMSVTRTLEWYDDLLTENCICCGKKAIRWTGHVNLNEGFVSAGFCNDTYCNEVTSDGEGNFGDWKVSFGLHYYDLRNE